MIILKRIKELKIMIIIRININANIKKNKADYHFVEAKKFEKFFFEYYTIEIYS